MRHGCRYSRDLKPSRHPGDLTRVRTHFHDQWSWRWAPPPDMKMPWRYRADGAWLAPPRKIGPLWLVQVHRICLAKPKTNSCARPRKAGQWPHPLREDHRFLACSITRCMPNEFHLSSPTRPGTFKHAFPAFAKRTGALSPPEMNTSPGWLTREPVAPAPPTGGSRGGGAHFHDKRQRGRMPHHAASGLFVKPSYAKTAIDGCSSMAGHWGSATRSCRIRLLL